MNRIGAFASALVLVFTPALWGQGLQLSQYGAVDVRKLPPPGKYTGKVKHQQFYTGDLDAFKKKKKDADSGLAAASPGAPVVGASGISTGPGSGFDGMSLADSSLGAVPPDTQVAAGAGYIVEAVNIDVRIWNMNVSPPAVTDFDLVSFFGVYFSDLISDPRIRFDPVQQRWYLSAVSIEQTFANPPQGDFRLAVSTSSDPTQPFTLYAATTSGSFPDFPHLGFNEDKLVLTGNSYQLPLATNSQFLGTEFLVANKNDLMNPAVTSPHTQFFGAPQGLDSISPADSLSATCSGGVCPLYMAAVPDASLGPSNILRVWSLTGTPGVGSGVSMTKKDFSIPALSIPPGAVQQGSTNLIETNDARLLDAIYRDGSLWVSSTTGCTPSGDSTVRACLHFSQVNTAAMTLAQDFDYGTPAAYYYYPAIQIDSSDNLVAVFNRSSATEYPSIYASGQGAGATPGTLATPISVFEGQFPLTPSDPTFNRWGDYSGAALDPSGSIVWVAGEYVHSASTDDWGTFIAPVNFSAGSGLTPTTTTVGTSGSPSTFGQPVTFTATVSSGGGTPTGNVTFKDGTTTLGSPSLNGSGQATLITASLTVGMHSITATYGGDSSFAGSGSSTLTQTVNLAGTTTTVATSGSPSMFGQPVTFTATVTSGGGTPTGTVTFKDGATTLGSGTLNGSAKATFTTSSLSVAGSPHSITATYTGSGNFAASAPSPAITQNVSQATTTASVTSSPNPSRLNRSVTFTAKVTSATGATPAGSVSFKDGATTLATKTLGSGGSATFSTSSLSLGSHSITVVYAGNVNFVGSTSAALTQTVNRR